MRLGAASGYIRHCWRAIEFPVDRCYPDGIVGVAFEFGDFAAITEFEAIAFKEAFATTVFVDLHLAEYAFVTTLLQVVNKGENQAACTASIPIAIEEIDMKVYRIRDALGGLSGGFESEPREETEAGPVVTKTEHSPEHFGKSAPSEHPELAQAVMLVLDTTQEVADYFVPIDCDERTFRLKVGVVAGEKISEGITVAEDRIDWFAHKSGFAADMPDGSAVFGSVGSNLNLHGESLSYFSAVGRLGAHRLS